MGSNYQSKVEEQPSSSGRFDSLVDPHFDIRPIHHIQRQPGSQIGSLCLDCQHTVLVTTYNFSINLMICGLKSLSFRRGIMIYSLIAYALIPADVRWRSWVEAFPKPEYKISPSIAVTF